MALACKMVTFDCADPRRLAQFWCQAVGGSVTSDFGGEFVIIAAPSLGVEHLGFQKVPEGKTAKSRCHLDLASDDRANEVRRLVDLGATAGEEHSAGRLMWTRMQDPAGNEFCVAQE